MGPELFGRRAAVASAAAALLGLAFMAAPLVGGDDEPVERTWQGVWNNRRYKTSGPLRCRARTEDGVTWKGRFEGTFKGEKFGYDANFKAKKKGTGADLKGDAVVDGDQYEWTGGMTPTTLTGKFRSGKGHFGEFNLKEAKGGKK